MSYSLEWIGHSCVIIHIKNYSIIIDPFLDHNPKTLKKVQDIEKIDLILLTHAHMDHIADAVPLALKTQAPIVCNPELAFYLKKIAPVQTIEIGIGGMIYPEANMNIKDLESIKMVSALHSSSIEIEGNKYYAGLAAGFIITLNIENTKYDIYHVGDTALSWEMKQLQGQIHLALMPIDGKYNMGITDVQKAIEWIQPEIFIPIHYNTFDAIEADPTLIHNSYGKVIILDQHNPHINLG